MNQKIKKNTTAAADKKSVTDNCDIEYVDNNNETSSTSLSSSSNKVFSYEHESHKKQSITPKYIDKKSVCDYDDADDNDNQLTAFPEKNFFYSQN